MPVLNQEEAEGGSEKEPCYNESFEEEKKCNGGVDCDSDDSSLEKKIIEQFKNRPGPEE